MTNTNDTRDAGFGEASAQSSTAKEFNTSRALLVGIDAYEQRIPELTTAVNDAKALAQTLESLHKYQVTTLTDHQATRDKLLGELDPEEPGSWASEIGPDDRVIFYFAGHGLAEQGDDGPAGYLLPQDANRGVDNDSAKGQAREAEFPPQPAPDQDQNQDEETKETPSAKVDPLEAENKFLAMGRLHKLLTNLPCRHMLIVLDCCFAGAMRWATMRAVHVPPKTIHQQRYQHYIQSPAWQLLTSAAYDQKALDVMKGRMYARERPSTKDKHSPFAQALIDALSKDVADTFPPPTNGQPAGDGLLTIYELFQYLEDTVWQGASEVEHVQTPELWPLKKHRNGQFVFDIPGKKLNLPDAGTLTLDHNPYRGLESFEANEHHLFFGRQQAIEDLVQQVTDKRLTVVLGASGTGKSSLVKAGLLPVLQGEAFLRPDEAQQPLNTSQPDESMTIDLEGWCVLPPLRPTADPIGQLAEHLQQTLEIPQPDLRAEAPDGLAKFLTAWATENPKKRLLLTIDQFEELITACREQERLAFLALLTDALRVQPQWFRLVVTLRTDFEPQLAHLALKPYWETGRFIVQPMRRRELQEAIEGPASERILYFDPPELVERLIIEVIDTPGALPLLSFALKQMYINYIRRNSNNRAITEADYKALGGDKDLSGGVIGALRHTANREYEVLSEAEQATMRRMMLRMISTGGGELTRRKVPLTELKYSDSAENKRAEKILERLTHKDVRLLVTGAIKQPDGTDEPYVEPAHDALVRAWDKLTKWTQESAEDLPLQRRLNQAAMDWDNEQDEQAKINRLWTNNPNLPRLEEIVTGERMPEDQGLLTRWRQQFINLWRSRTLVPAKGHWLNKLELNFVQESVFRRQRDARRLVGTVTSTIIILAILVVIAGYLTYQTNNLNTDLEAEVGVRTTAQFEAETETNLRATEVISRTTAEAVAIERQIAAETAQAQEVAAAATAEARRVEAERQLRIARARELAAESQNALTNNLDPTGSLPLMLAREAILTTWQANTTLSESAVITKPFVTVQADAALRQAISNAEQLSWQRTVPWRQGHTAGVTSVAFSPDGLQIISGSEDQTVRVWDVTSGEELLQFSGHTAGITSVAFSPDGLQIVSGSEDQTVRVWDVASGEELLQFSGHTDIVNSVTFNSDGSQIVSGSGDTLGSVDQTVRVWDVASGEELRQFSGHTDIVSSVAFSPDGLQIVSGSEDQTVRVWDVASGEELLQFSGHTDIVNSVTFSPDGLQIVSGSEDQTVRVWNVASGEELLQFSDHTDIVNSVAFSPDGSQIVSGSGDPFGSIDQTLRLWDVASGEELRQFSGHTAGISSVAFSPDGSQIVSGSEDQTVRVWGVASGEELHQFSGHTAFVSSVAFSPDGSQIVSGGGYPFGSIDQTVRLWDVASGEELRQFSSHIVTVVSSVAFSPDGSQIVSGGFDQTVRLWDVASGEDVRQFSGHTAEISSVAFSLDGSQIVSGSGDQTVRLWDVASGKELRSFSGHTANVRSVAFSPDGSQIVSGSDDQTVRLWDVASRKELRSFSGHTANVRSVAFSPDGSQIVSGGFDQTLRLWDVTSGEELRQFSGHTPVVWSLAFSPDGSQIVSGGEDQTVRVWDVASGEELHQFFGHTAGVSSVAFSPDGLQIVSGSFDQTVRWWDMVSEKELHQFSGHTAGISSVAFSPDGSQIVSGSGGEGPFEQYGDPFGPVDRIVRLWDVTSGEELRQFSGHTDIVNSVAFSPDGLQIVSGSSDQTLRLWDVISGEELRQFSGHTDIVRSVTFSPDGLQIASGSGRPFGEDQTVRLWDVTNGKELRRFSGHTDIVNSVAFSPDGLQIVSGSEDQTVRLWEVASGEELRQFFGHTDDVLLVAFSPDGSQIASGSNDQTVRLWDASNGEELRQFSGHTSRVTSVAFSPDGSQIVSGSSDKTVRLWDASSGEGLRQFSGHTSWVTSVAFSPDGSQIVSGSSDQMVRLWPDIDALLQLADILIQRDPPIFQGQERSRYGFSGLSRHEQNLGHPKELTKVRLAWLTWE